MKEASGYVTEDGTFFEDKVEAELFEAEIKLRKRLEAAFPQVDDDQFLAIVFEVMPQLGNYIYAHNTASAAQRNQQAKDKDRAEADGGASSEVDASLGHVSSTEEDLASLLKLPSRRPSDVPDVGRGAHTTEVPDRSAKHGARVRRGDASSVRRRKDMAAEQSTEPGQPRTSRR